MQPASKSAPTPGQLNAGLSHGIGGDAGSGMAGIDGVPLTSTSVAASMSTSGAGDSEPMLTTDGAGQPPGEEATFEEDEAVIERFNVADVNPETLERARTAVLAMLESNSGACPKQFVRNLLKQVGVPGMPISALGEEVFFGGAEVFLRRGPPEKHGIHLKSPVPEALQQQLVALVRDG